jgi:hypothetical protein
VCLGGWKVGQKGDKKEKKKETPIRSLPMYIRLPRDQRQASTLPENVQFRD